MWLVVSATLCLCYVLRRYRNNQYFTQRFSRKCDYIQKAAVAPLKVPWGVKYCDYRPLGEIKETLFWWFNLTRVDGTVRFLIEVSPYTFCRVPVNPLGRTGVVGKGLLPHYGPNRMTLTILWSKTLGFLKVVYSKKGTLLFTGYLDHAMNTDNAWIEATIYLYEVVDYPGKTEVCPEWLISFVKELSI